MAWGAASVALRLTWHHGFPRIERLIREELGGIHGDKRHILLEFDDLRIDCEQAHGQIYTQGQYNRIEAKSMACPNNKQETYSAARPR